MLTYKFRLYPTVAQEKKLLSTLEACRYVYNYFVRNGYMTRNDMNYALTELKEQRPWLNNYHSKMLQMVSTQVAGARKALVEKRKKGYKVGKFGYAKRDEYDTFTYNQSGFKVERHGSTDLLWLSKIGYMEIRLHRAINGTIKQITITKKAGRWWYACIVIDMKEPTVSSTIDFKKAVGIDVGIKNYTYDSNGKQTPNPENIRKMLKPLIRANRKLSRRVYNSNNYKKAKRHYQIIHERIANRRKDFLHKLSTQYTRRYDVIFLERLRINNMVKNHHLARSIMDASWDTFTNMVDYKAKLMVEVDPHNTTVECSRCGNKVSKTLAVRTHRCDVCGLILDRDHNSSITIFNRGMTLLELPMEHREVTPVEILMESRKQEKPISFSGG